ncbi:hypothetical protein ACFWP0_13170 [Achromobacter sp. NPDC058515]|uniref:hypothetical protein n=1 Tax=Achromobacter sp. NPDC058515 TaxID=3346533 RepID=UPI00366768B9
MQETAVGSMTDGSNAAALNDGRHTTVRARLSFWVLSVALNARAMANMAMRWVLMGLAG